MQKNSQKYSWALAKIEKNNEFFQLINEVDKDSIQIAKIILKGTLHAELIDTVIALCPIRIARMDAYLKEFAKIMNVLWLTLSH